jgi:hypothetical protein
MQRLLTANDKGNPAAAKNHQFQNPPDPPLGLTASLSNLLLSSNDFGQRSQRLVHGIVVGKDFRDVRLNDYNVGALGISFCILTLNAFAEGVFIKHVWIFSHSLHIVSFLSWTPFSHLSA